MSPRPELRDILACVERSRIIMPVLRMKKAVFVPKFDFDENFQEKLDGWTDFSTGGNVPF